MTLVVPIPSHSRVIIPILFPVQQLIPIPISFPTNSPKATRIPMEFPTFDLERL